MSTEAAALAQFESDETLRSLLGTYEALCPNDDGVWQCDIGAAVLAWLCDRAGVTRRLRSGIYWHPDIESYNATLGYAEGSDDWADWTDEAHCWIEVDRDYGTFIIDSNPERLPGTKPRVWLLDTRIGFVWDATAGHWMESPFEDCNDRERDMIGYDVDEDIDALAEDKGFSRNLGEILTAARQRLGSGADATR